MILHDFAPIVAPPVVKSEDDSAIAAGVSLLEQMTVLRAVRYTAECQTHGEQDALATILKRMGNTLTNTRMQVFTRQGGLPTALKLGENDVLTRAADTPRILLSTVRDIAEKLGFVAIPFNYLDERSFAKESYEMTYAIKNFWKALAPYFQIYVLCPVFHYSVSAHVNAEEDAPIFAGTTSVQAFMAINMNIPMFRQLTQQVDDVERRQRRTDARVAVTERNIATLATQVEQLSQAVERQQAQILLQVAKLAEQEEAIRAMSSSFVPYEPMMFAFPKSLDIGTDESAAIVGPCWGPDFADIVVTLRGFEKVKGQRAKLAKLAQMWGR